jgi:O-glycosyl hydrolase
MPVAAVTAATLIASLVTSAALPGDTQASSQRAPALPSATIGISDQGSYAFDGWGTSLAWWAEAAGSWQDEQQRSLVKNLFGAPDISNAATSPLGLTIARYNIGASPASGGQNQAGCPGSAAPQFPRDIPAPQQGPTSPVDISQDRDQLSILKDISSVIGSDPQHYEAFANSPPFWMLTPGQCPIGDNHLDPGKFGAYAQYLISVLHAFRQQGISFGTIDPFNEPSPTHFHWPNGCTSNCQEAANISPADQSAIAGKLCDALGQSGLSTRVAAMDENTPDGAGGDYSHYDQHAKSCLGQFNTHSYGTSGDRKNVAGLAALGPKLWMSEFGNAGAPDSINAGQQLARMIARDLQYMRPRAWVYWQAMEAAGDSNWGLLADPSFPHAGSLEKTFRYDALAQYSEFIRPGYSILKASRQGAVQTFTVAARDPATGQTVLVTTNCDAPNDDPAQSAGAGGCADSTQDRSIHYDLRSLGVSYATVSAWRTSGNGAPGDQLQPVTSGLTVDNNTLTDANQPAGSITTYVVSPPGLPGTGHPAQHVTYTGPVTADYHDAFTASATLTSGGDPVPGQPVTFRLGSGGGTQECQATTGSSGSASCPLTPDQVPGQTTLTVRSGSASASVPFTIAREETAVAYTGPSHIANGVSAQLSAVLKEDGTVPISGRPVSIALGSGPSRQECTGTTDGTGTASCTIRAVNQPLTDTATVPVTVSFGGDAFYLPSRASASVRLEYYTGRAFGLSAGVHPPVLTVRIPPSPDTGKIRVAKAMTTTTPCTASVSTVLVTAGALCPRVTTHLAPGTSTATATVSDVSVGLPGVPVIELSGVRATSTSTCGAASGNVSLTVRVAGTRIAVSTAPGSGVRLPGGTRLIVNEQRPVPGADFGLTVTAAHLILPAGLGQVTIASATSDAHNCS